MLLHSLITIVMLAQSGISDLPPLQNTDIKVVLPDLTTVLAVAEWQGDHLVLSNPLTPWSEVRLLISHAPSGLLLVPNAVVAPTGRDILIERDTMLSNNSEEGYVSFRNLLHTQQIVLDIPVR